MRAPRKGYVEITRRGSPKQRPGGCTVGLGRGLGFPFQRQCLSDPVGQLWGFVGLSSGGRLPPAILLPRRAFQRVRLWYCVLHGAGLAMPHGVRALEVPSPGGRVLWG